MKCVLPTLGKCDVVVIYKRDEKGRPVRTVVELYLDCRKNPDNLFATGESRCHKNDVCVKLKGRTWALNSLVKNYQLSPEDKTVLYSVVCPSLFSKNKVNELARRNRPGYRWLQAKLGY